MILSRLASSFMILLRIHLIKKVTLFLDAVIAFITVPLVTGLGKVTGLARETGEEIDLSSVRKILIARLNRMGDIVMTTPFLREFRKLFPEAEITLIVSRDAFNLMQNCPYVDKVFDFGPLRGGLLRSIPLKGLDFAFRTRAKDQPYDLAVVPRWNIDCYQAVYAAYLSGARWRIGYSEKAPFRKAWYRKNYDSLLTHALSSPGFPYHEVERNLEVSNFLGGKIANKKLELWAEKEDDAFAEKIWKEYGLEKAGVVAVCPGAGTAKRIWPPAYFAQLANWLNQEYGARILLVGSRQESALGETIEQTSGVPVINWIGKSHLRQTYCLLKRCALFLGNDSGPAHLAAAAGIPVVVISCHPAYGAVDSPNAPERVAPWTERKLILRPAEPLFPCRDECFAGTAHCITQITSDQAKNSVYTFLKELNFKNGSV